MLKQILDTLSGSAGYKLAVLGALLLSACGAPEAAHGEFEGDNSLDAVAQPIVSGSLVGYWEKVSGAGPVQYVEFTTLTAPSAAGLSGGKTFVMRSTNYPDEFVGAYKETSTSNAVPVALWGTNLGPLSFRGTWNIAVGGCSSGCITATAPGTPPTVLKKSTAALVMGGGTPVKPITIITPGGPTATSTVVTDFAAAEMRRHLELAFNGFTFLYSEDAIRSETDIGQYPRVYLGNTNFAQKLGITALATAKGSWLSHVVGKAIVLYGPESGRAARPSAIEWVTGERAIRMRRAPLRTPDATTSPEKDDLVDPDDPRARHFELILPGNAQLFSDTEGGTIEFWIRDDETECMVTGVGCWGGSYVRLYKGPHAVSTNLYLNHRPDGLGIAFWAGGILGFESAVPVPRDGTKHHVTISVEPSGNSQTPVKVSTWIDGNPVQTGQVDGSWKTTQTWDQRLRIDEDGHQGWGLKASLYGLRFAAKPSTLADHQSRADISSMGGLVTGDRVLFNFRERSGIPINKANGANVVVPPLPALWGDRGTLHATYEWLQRALGVRWYGPGKLNIGATKVSAFSVPRERFVMASPLKFRYAYSPLWFTPPLQTDMNSVGEMYSTQDRDEWALRVGMGGENIARGHPYEYDYDHQFQPVSPYGRKQPCLSDPNVLNLTKASAQAYASAADDLEYQRSDESKVLRFASDGYFAVAPNDGEMLNMPLHHTDDCNYAAANARGLINTAPPVAHLDFSREASDYVFDFYNQIARSAPSIKVTGLAYFDYAYPPRQAIESNLVPFVAFILRDYRTVAGRNGAPLFDAWAATDTQSGYAGWTYMFDSIAGRYSAPSFEYRAIADAARSIVAARSAQFSGLVFEHSYAIGTYADPAAIVTSPELRFVKEQFAAFDQVQGPSPCQDAQDPACHLNRDLTKRWPLSLSWTGSTGYSNVFRCSSETPYTEFCDDWAEMLAQQGMFDKVYVDLPNAATHARSSMSAQLDLFFLLKRMTDPVAVGSNSLPPALNVESELTRYFTQFYGAAAVPMRAIYDRLAALPSEGSIACSDQHGGHEWAVCKWGQRLTRNVMQATHADLSAATSLLGSDKRLKAFKRNVWCVFVRAYYDYDPEASSDRENDTLNVAQVCADDSSLQRFVAYNGNRYLME